MPQRTRLAFNARHLFMATALLLLACVPAHAVELRISAQALERTLQKQLFNGPEGRYYMRGNEKSACYVYAEDPKVSFVQDRVVVHVKTHAKLGGGLFGSCVGLGMSPEADVSVLPNAENESLGFRDARVDKLSESKELNFLLVPFLSRKLPQQMTVNAATLLRQMLSTSQQTTGYDMNLVELHIHSMQVIGDALVVDVDGQLSVK
jgi:hypothetical protein